MAAPAQLGFDPQTAPAAATAERRLDITLGRLDAAIEAMPEDERSKLATKPWWCAIALLSRVRGMELAEESVLGRSIHGVADLYDRLVEPGEHPIEALLRVYQAAHRPTSVE